MAITLDGTNGILSPDFEPSSSTTPTNGLFLPAANALGFATNSTERLRLDASGNLGLGVTPSAWSSAFKVFQGYGGFLASNGSAVQIAGANAYSDGTNWRYIATAAASFYAQVNGVHSWSTAPSGTAGAAISFTQAMTLDASACLGVGETSPSTYAKFVSTTAYGQPAGWFSSPSNTTQQAIVTIKNTTNDSYLSIAGVGTSSSVPTWANGSFVIEGVPYSSGNTIFSSYIGALVFQTNGRTERARIDSSGNLLVGTTGSDARLHVVRSLAGSTIAWIQNGSGTGVALYAGNSSWTGTSDETVKDIIEPIIGAVSKVSVLRSVIGKFKDDKSETRRAFLIAQDVQKVLPEAVSVMPTGKLGIQYTDTIPLLVAAIKELTARLEALEAK